MKALYIAAGLILATATAASATETFTNASITNSLSAVPVAAQVDLNDCLSTESSSRAIRACSKTIRAAQPNDDVRAHLYTRRALHRMALGRYDDAASDFTRAGELKDDDGLELLGHGFTAMMQNDLSKARRKFEDCNNRGKIAPIAEYGLGLTYQMAGETLEAREAYQRALSLRPNWTAVTEQMATLETP